MLRSTGGLRKLQRGTAVALAAIGAPALPALAQQPAPAHCAAPEFSQLDFWTGDWEVNWRFANGQSGTGRNRVVREYGGCVVVERFQDGTTDFAGTSIATFMPAAGSWAFTWMDNRATTFRAIGGPVENGAAFEFVIRQGNGEPAPYRIRFEEIGRDSLTWRFQSRGADGNWTDMTVSRYRRRPEA